MRRLFIVSSILWVAAFGCQKNRTEIIVGFATDLEVPKSLSNIELEVHSVPDTGYPIFGPVEVPVSNDPDKQYVLPATWAIYSQSGSADRFRVKLTATNQAGQTVVVRAATMTLVPEQTLFVRLGTVSACAGMTDCCQGISNCDLTCVEGACVSEKIDSSRLPHYAPGLENVVSCSSGTTFQNTATHQPLAAPDGGGSCPPGGTCLDGVCLSPPVTDAGANQVAATPSCTRNSDCVGSETLTGVAAITNRGLDEPCALLSDGTVKCWVGTVSYPTEISGAKSISGTLENLCAVTTSGAVQCFGDNEYGQLGNGTIHDGGTTNNGYVTTPVTVSGLSGATAVAVSWDSFACALLTGGTVKCWGQNSYGQLGNGTTTDSDVPTTVSGLSGATAIAAGVDSACALLTGGTVTCWGANYAGQLGNGSDVTSNSSVPVPVSGLSGVTAISVGDEFACALLPGGTVKCWGYGYDGELGNGAQTSSPVPVSVTGVSGATAITAGNRSACALLANRSVQCWGDVLTGQSSDASTNDGGAPTTVAGLSNVTAVTVGYQTACALLADGMVQCWGALSDDTEIFPPTPVTTGPVCAFGYCVGTCVTSSECPQSERCVRAQSLSPEASVNTSQPLVACQAPEIASCSKNHACPAPLLCGPDNQCHDSCASSDYSGCLPNQVCTSVTMLCADPTIDKEYSPAINDFLTGAGGATSTGGGGGSAGTLGSSDGAGGSNGGATGKGGATGGTTGSVGAGASSGTAGSGAARLPHSAVSLFRSMSARSGSTRTNH